MHKVDRIDLSPGPELFAANGKNRKRSGI